MSACACVYSVSSSRKYRDFDVDVILNSGDELYMQLLPNLTRENQIYLLPEQLPSRIRSGIFSAEIEPMEDDSNWIANGLYPVNITDIDRKKIDLEYILQTQVFTRDHIDATDSIIFTGQSYTVSFWRHQNSFYLFNSHGVDCNNRTADECARLFKCNSMKKLVDYLFANSRLAKRREDTEYVLHRIRVKTITPSPTFTPSSLISSLSRSATDVLSPTFTESLSQSDVSRPRSPTYAEICAKNCNERWVLNSVSQTSATTTNINAAQPQKKSKRTNLNPVVVVDRVEDFKLSVLNPVVIVHNMFSELPLDENESNVDTATVNRGRGRPKKQKRGTKANAHLDAVKKYAKKNPDVNRSAVKKYIEKHPEVHRAAVEKYSKNHPEVNRAAVEKYTNNHPEVHRAAVEKYTNNHPEVNRAAVEKYTNNHPEVHRAAVEKYSENHPEVNREAVVRYTSDSRDVEVELRGSTNLIGQWRESELANMPLFSLKKPSLLATDIFSCPNCNARLFEEERGRKQWCCGSGAYNVQQFSPLSEDFYFDPSFLRAPRAYNNLFAFSALGVSHGYQHPEQGISFLKIQGRIYHRVFDLSYEETTNNIGLYINDNNERDSIAQSQRLNRDVTISITNYLYNVNPYIECFKRLSQETSDQAYIRFERTTRATHGNILGDLPLGTEVAAIISTERETFQPHCIAIWKVGQKKPHTVDIMNPLYEAFQYPLLYPEGNPGWYPNKLDNNQNKLSQVKYIRCLLLSESRFSKLGRLSEEWLVDVYCRICEERLRYITNMQKQNSNHALRTAPLEEIEISVQQIRNDETIEGEGYVPGRIYLPNSFTGCPRYMKVKYMDAIAIVNTLGTPTYFLTFTCNRNWPEIKQSLVAGQLAADPLICARVFNLKLAQLLRDIRSGRWFGKCLYMFHVIEFQKRGLPHAHICFKVENGPMHNVDIDKVVRADIPNSSEADGKLRTTVLKHMIHGPCGPPHRVELPCWDRESHKCTKFFPKSETAVTFADDKGFVNLRRDSKNVATITHKRREFVVSDLWVVPYNAALLLKYDAHMNLEVSSQRTIVKYLFKYMTKGPDESRVAVVSEEHLNDEVEQYVTKRYLGSGEAAWRTLEFDVTAREPNVKQLAVHLESRHSVFFRPGTEAESAQQSTSNLLTYFNRPAGDEFDHLTYCQFYEQYLVHASRPKTKNTQIYETTNNRFVTKRQRGELVARLFWVAPNRGEQFYLRILLKSYPARSYAELISLGGPNCNTFQEAAKIVGLADDEVEYERAMLEASTFYTGPRLRSFFVLLACNGAPVALLWDTFKNQLSEDFLHRNPGNADMAYNLALMEVNRILRKHGSSLTEHGLPQVSDLTTELSRERVEYSTDRLEAYVDEWLPRLSSDQRVVFDYVNRLCVDDSFRDTANSAIFIDGPAGTGKTQLLNVVTAHVRGVLKGVVLCTASSAIAAQNYEGGTTAHSMFRYPLDIVDDLGYWNITNLSQRAELISNAKVIIYDEAPMAHKYLIHLLDRSLRDLMRSDKDFGGKIIIFAGDFRQIPPVVSNAKSNSDILNCSVKSSPLWQRLGLFSLVTSQRCRGDSEFASFLLKLGSNCLTSVADGNVKNLIDLSLIEHVTELNDLIDFVFPLETINRPDECARRAILCTRNDAVNEINNAILDRFTGDVLRFYSCDKIDSDNVDQVFYGIDALNRIEITGVPHHELKLKVGCVCMIMRNLSFEDGLVNGTKVIIVRCSARLITVRKPESSEEFLIPRILFKQQIDPRNPFELCRRQFPLRLSYAMTIHKSQGQTIARVGVDLRSDIFSHGQLYVALGRVRELNNIKILVHRDRIRNEKPYAINVVIPELL